MFFTRSLSYHKNPSNNPHYWYDNQNSPKLNSWRGIAFEDVCFVHQEQIRNSLGISGVQAAIFPWRAYGNEEAPVAQIDMLIDRADRVVNMCEMNFSRDEFSIDNDGSTLFKIKADSVIMKSLELLILKYLNI